MEAQKYAPVAKHAVMCKRRVRRVLHKIQSRDNSKCLTCFKSICKQRICYENFNVLGAMDMSMPGVAPPYLKP